MNNKLYKMSKLKNQLLDKKRKNKSNPCWKLNHEQKNYVENTLGFRTTPVIYSITTRSFQNIRQQSSILKDIHYAFKRGVPRMVRKLSMDEKKVLDEHSVKYTPYKYVIHLR